MSSRLAANAVLNVLAGASGALFAVAVPALLAGRISAVDLSIWSVMLQTAVYTAPFTLGIQAVLARQVALHSERKDARGLRRTMDAAFRVLGITCLLYLVLGLIVAVELGRIYPAIPAERLPAAQIGFVLFLLGQATLIPAAALAGYFFGLQRNLPVTINALGAKVLASLAVVALAGTIDLAGLAAVVSAVLIGGNLWLLAAWRRTQQPVLGSPSSAHRTGWPACLSILRSCAPISLWTLASFLIYGGTSTIASRTDFANFPAYVMATGAAMVLLGLHGAALNPLIPHIAVVQERGGAPAVATTLSRASMISDGLSALILLVYATVGTQLIDALIPTGLSDATALLLPVLLIGNAIRLVGLPYSNTLVGLGLQGRILWTPVLEAGATFGSALWLGPRYGLPGVAASIAVGGVVSIIVHYTVNMTLTRQVVPVRRWRLSLHSLLLLGPAIAVLQNLHLSG